MILENHINRRILEPYKMFYSLEEIYDKVDEIFKHINICEYSDLLELFATITYLRDNRVDLATSISGVYLDKYIDEKFGNLNISTLNFTPFL